MPDISLAALPRPTIPGLVLGVDAVQADMHAWLATNGGRAIPESAADPEWRLVRLLAGREAVLRQSIADALAENSLAYATGGNLDNIAVTFYGLGRLDGEKDEPFRRRLAAAPSRYAVGLTGPWYESVARGVPGVVDALVTSPTPGAVRIYVLADEEAEDDDGSKRWPNGVPDNALLSAVYTAVTAPETRQQTDTVTISACTRLVYDAGAALTLRAGPSAGAVLAAAKAALDALAARTARLGGKLDKALVAAAVVDPEAVVEATVTIKTVVGQVETVVDSIAAADSAAPQARNLTVTVTVG